ncbi:MAG: hypothetical protein U9N73_03675, partial [Candidatus Auribacterota bacterium]|nr:hypothetical protein [Candidatus Auribacterota bacterium]
KILVIILAAIILGPAVVMAQISPDSRLLQRPEFDGAVITGPWLRSEMRYQHWKLGDEIKSDSFLIGPTFAIPIAYDLVELGGRTSVIYYDPDTGGDQWGFSDIDIWGKYMVMDDPCLISVGMLITLPTGEEKVIYPRASGEFNVELFSGIRYYISELVTLIGHMNLRYNSDMDAEVEVGGTRVSSEIDGKVSFGLGGGIIFEVAPGFNILGELSLETERYDDMDNDIELTGGMEYFLNEMVSLNGGLGVGIDKGAPEFEIIGGINVLF